MNGNSLDNSLSGVPAPQLTLGLHQTTIPEYTDGDVACLSFNKRGQLRVVIDSESEIDGTKLEAEVKQTIAIATIKYQSKNSRAILEKDKAIAVEQVRCQKVVSTHKYVFYATLARWALGAATLISSCYILA